MAVNEIGAAKRFGKTFIVSEIAASLVLVRTEIEGLALSTAMTRYIIASKRKDGVVRCPGPG